MNFAFSVTAGPKGAQNAHRKGGDSAHREFHVSFAAIGAERSWAAAAETQSLDRLPMPLSAGIPLSAARAGAIAAWLLLPIVVAVGLGGVGWSRTALVTFLWWKLLVFPHDWIVVRTAYASEPILVGGSAAVAAIVQWTIVALVFSRLSRVRSARTVGWVAPLVIVFVAVVVQLTIPIVGWKYEPDGP